MNPTTALYLGASALALALALAAPRGEREHAGVTGLVMLLSCAFCNLTWAGSQPWAWPPLDASVVVLVASQMRQRPRAWKAVVLYAYYGQFCAHWARLAGLDKAAYEAVLNVWFVIMLLAVASTGSGRVRDFIRGHVAAWINAGRRGHGHVVLGVLRPQAGPEQAR